MKHYVLAVALLSLACGVEEGRARIGGNYDECVRLWGIPVEGETGSANTGRSVFRVDGAPLEICFVEGIAQKVSLVGAVPKDEAAIQKTLTQFGGGELWHSYCTPGLRGEPQTVTTRWMRADEEAMAEWIPGERLTLIGARWHPHLAEPRQAASRESEKPATSQTTALAPVDLKGYWRADAGEHACVVLQVDPSGALVWMAYGEQERVTQTLRWRAYAHEGTGMWVHEGVADAEGEPVGRLTLNDSGLLNWQMSGDAAHAEGAYPSLKQMRWAEFARIAELPAWNAVRPDRLPVPGDSRAHALRLLGEPDGRIASGAKEILVYPWGRVRVMNDRVESID